MRLFLSKLCAIFHILIIAIPLFLRLIYFNVVKYDIYILLFFLFIRLHWFFLKGECIISYFEKKLLLPTYKMGDDIFNSPFLEMFFKKKTFDQNLYNEYYRDFYQNIYIFFILFSNVNSKNFNLLLVISIVCIVLMFCYSNLYRNHLKKRIRENKITITDTIYIDDL
jgi:hypothetical protein